MEEAIEEEATEDKAIEEEVEGAIYSYKLVSSYR